VNLIILLTAEDPSEEELRKAHDFGRSLDAQLIIAPPSQNLSNMVPKLVARGATVLETTISEFVRRPQVLIVNRTMEDCQ
jgi:hypothetical protein